MFYHAITEFVILMDFLGKRSDLPFSRKSDRKNEKSTVFYTHVQNIICSQTLHRRKMSTHALQQMTRDLFRAMSLAPGQKYPRNVVEMNAFFGSDSVATSCHCKRSIIILVEVLTEVCSLENIASWNWRKIAVAWSDSVLLTLRSLVCMWKTCRKGG